MINIENLEKGLMGFKGKYPFDHCVVDNFFEAEFAELLSKEFPTYDFEKWFYYKNPIEDKKALNDWNIFPDATYKAFFTLQSEQILKILSNALEKHLYIDPGLHGGGWHIHGDGGNLNPHLDYSIHPKLGLQRKLNIIIYLSKELIPELHGGHLGLWKNDVVTQQPGQLEVEIEPIFNRAVIFDTTQMSWHGMSRVLNVPNGIYRKSLAIYYLAEPSENAANHLRALFAPRESQKDDSRIVEIIKLRSGIDTSNEVYKCD